jgi:hypothetical protein
MDQYAVFTPDEPNVHFLNDAARLVLMFCDGRSGDDLEQGYCAAMAPLVGRTEAAAELRRTLEDLERKGIVRNTQRTPTSTARETVRHGKKDNTQGE